MSDLLKTKWKTHVQRAAEVLRESGKPLTAREIGFRIGMTDSIRLKRFRTSLKEACRHHEVLTYTAEKPRRYWLRGVQMNMKEPIDEALILARDALAGILRGEPKAEDVRAAQYAVRYALEIRKQEQQA